MAQRKRLTATAKLANYWKRRSKLLESDFDVFQDQEVRGGRSRYWILTEGKLRNATVTFDDAVCELAHLIATGYPLNEFEYHLAVACHYLLADGIAYEDFYKHHWHETRESRGYRPLPRTRRSPTKGPAT